MKIDFKNNFELIFKYYLKKFLNKIMKAELKLNCLSKKILNNIQQLDYNFKLYLFCNNMKIRSLNDVFLKFIIL